MFLAPSGWVRRIQLSVVERVRISSVFSLSVRPGQLMTIGCGLTVSSPQILSAPLLAFLKKGGIVKAVSPWYCVAWKTLFLVSEAISRRRIYVVYPCLASAAVYVRFVGLILAEWGHHSSGCVSEGATVLHPCLKGLMVGRWWLCPVWSLPGWGQWTYPRVQVVQRFRLLQSLEGL